MGVEWAFALGVLGGGGLVSVAATLYFRRFAVASPVSDVDELAVEVERIGKAVRRLTMQRVRQAAGDAPAELAPPIAPAALPALTPKNELRRRHLGGLQP